MFTPNSINVLSPYIVWNCDVVTSMYIITHGKKVKITKMLQNCEWGTQYLTEP